MRTYTFTNEKQSFIISRYLKIILVKNLEYLTLLVIKLLNVNNNRKIKGHLNNKKSVI